MAFVVLLATAVFAFYMYYTFVHKRRQYPPGPTPWPIVGNMMSMDQVDIDSSVNKYGLENRVPVYTMWMPQPTVVITDYATLKEAMLKTGDDLAGRPELRMFGRKGILQSERERWQEHRRFAMKVFRDFGMGKNVMQERIDYEIDRMLAYVKKDCATKGEIDPSHAIYITIASVIAVLMLNHRYEFEADKDFQEYLNMNDQMFAGFADAFYLDMFPILEHVPLISGMLTRKLAVADKSFRQFFARIIREHRSVEERRKEQGLTAEADDYISAYLQEVERLRAAGDAAKLALFDDDDQMYSCVFDVFQAGLLTSVATLRWAMLYITLTPSVQTRIVKEVDHASDSFIYQISR